MNLNLIKRPKNDKKKKCKTKVLLLKITLHKSNYAFGTHFLRS